MVDTAPARAAYAGKYDPLASTESSDACTLGEVLHRLDIRPTRGYELAARDELPIPAMRVGRTYRFSRRLLEALLDGTYVRPDYPQSR